MNSEYSGLNERQGRSALPLVSSDSTLHRSPARDMFGAVPGLSNTHSWISYLHSIWLFTFSDLKTIVGPKTVFGILNATSAPVFEISSAPPKGSTSQKILMTAFWTWVNLLPFAIDNQRQPAAIEEDRLNKPWRPMPSKRLTPEQAKRIMFLFYPIAFLVSAYIGGLRQCIALILLGYWYNDCGGADDSYITRNFINACGFICYSSGAMEVALESPLPLSETELVQWFLIIGGVIFTTIQIQDISDQAGDRLRGRKTMPLVLGDERCRRITVFLIGFWCLVCPWYWASHLGVHAAFAALGARLVSRIMWKRSEREDKHTFREWNLWVVFLYSLPLLKYVSSAWLMHIYLAMALDF